MIPTAGRVGDVLDRAVESAVAAAAQVVVVRQSAASAAAPVRAPGLVVIDDPGTGACRARNAGLGLVEADWVMFLDDDAALLPAFAAVAAALPALPEHQFVAWRVQDAAGRDVSRFPEDERDVTAFNHWRLTREHNTLWRTAALRAAGAFDDRLGPGRWAGAEEGADLMIRVLAAGGRGRYLPVVASTHPAPDDLGRGKARRYGRGAGAVIRAHAARPASWPFTLRTVAGLASVALPARHHRYPRRAKLDRGLGIAEGILHGPRAD